MVEPSYNLNNIILLCFPFVAYFLGIMIRKIAMRGKKNARLYHQLLLGIPVSLVVVSPFIPVLAAVNANGNIVGFLVTLGVIMEHGMLVNETATYHLSQLGKHMGMMAESEDTLGLERERVSYKAADTL